MIAAWHDARRRGRRVPVLPLIVILVALIPTATGAITYPQIAVGGGYETVLTLTNPAEQDWVGQFRFLTGNGQEFPIPLKANGQAIGSSAEWTIKAKNTVRYVITGDQALRNGYLTISRISGPEEWQLATSLFFRIRNASGAATDLVGSKAVTASKRVMFPIDRSPTSDTGIALLPSSGTPEPITLTLVRSDGTLVEEVQRAFPGHVAMMASELFLKLPATFLGAVTVESSEPIHVLVLRLEFGGDSVQLTGTAPLAVPPSVKAGVQAISFRVVDAEYSKSLDRIIAVARDPHRLHIFDPLTNSSQYVGLSAPPQCVSVSPDGAHAVVGHDSWLSYVNLVTRKVVKMIPIGVSPLDALLSHEGFAYLTTSGPLVIVRLSNGEEIPSAAGGIFGALHPNGRTLYLTANYDLIRVDLVGGLVAGSYSSYSSPADGVGGQAWFSEDGERVFTADAGTVMRASDVRGLDLQLNGSLHTPVTHLAHDQATDRVAFLVNDQVRLADYDGLQTVGTIYLPSFLPDKPVASQGRFVFYSSTGKKLFVIVQADPSVGLEKDFGIVVFDAEELE